MKKFALLTCVILVAACGHKTPEVIPVANRFVAASAAQRPTDAYDLMAFEFTKVNPFNAFSASLAQFDVDPSKPAVWQQPVPEGNGVKLNGTVQRKDGSVLGLELSFVDELGMWKISSVTGKKL